MNSITGDGWPAETELGSGTPFWPNAWNRVVIPGVMLGIFAEAGVLTKPWLGEGYASLIFVLGITLIGARSGLATAVICALLGAMIFNLVVADPLWELNFTRHTDFAPPAIFMACAVVSGLMSGRLRDETRRARQGNRLLESLLDTSRSLQGAETIAAVDSVLRSSLRRHLRIRTALYTLHGAEVAPAGATAADPDWLRVASEVATSRADLVREGQLAGIALNGVHGAVGALVVDTAGSEEVAVTVLPALARIAALALERADLAAEVAEVRAESRAEELKTALLSSISHDLRTPLTTISTSAASLRQFGKEIDDKTAGELLDGIVAQCDRLNRLTANLLEMSRLQAGDTALQLAVMPAVELIGKVVGEVRARGVRQAIAFTAPYGELDIAVDRALFELALVNVLENACKFSPARSKVTVCCRRVDSGCAIDISDEGPGIPVAEQGRVFERFYRIPGGARGAAGTGLGLASARGFVEASGGSIRIASPVAKGRGTTLTITLPLAGPNTAQEDAQ